MSRLATEMLTDEMALIPIDKEYSELTDKRANLRASINSKRHQLRNLAAELFGSDV